ncbi:MAG: tetratricopeptide repeat protein [Bdellovibrionales bacterium]|nr:tetratricopeptide repeat protein [Bdellovibrionales bacterium]
MRTALLALLVLVPALAHAVPDQLALKKTLVLQGRYDDLERELGGYEKAFRANPAAEEDYVLSGETFALNDPALDAATTGWITAKPESAWAHYARGSYLVAEGWRRRGGKWIHLTSGRQLRGMEVQFAAAEKELARAVALGGPVELAVIKLQNIQTVLPDADKERERYDQSLRLNPYSFQARFVRLNQLRPRWGGDYGKMQELIDDAQKYADKHPRLRELAGVIERDQASLLWDKKRYREALPLLNTAVAKGDHYLAYRDRAWLQSKLGDVQRAIADYDVVLRRRPDEVFSLRRRGMLYYKLKQYPKALADLDRAVKLEPADEGHVFERANVHKALGNFAQAESDYTKALELDPDDYWNWKVRARLYRKLNQHEKAIADAREALKRKPRDVATWYEHAQSLHRLNRYEELVQAAERIIEYANPKDSSTKEALNWANQTLALARAKGLR